MRLLDPEISSLKKRQFVCFQQALDANDFELLRDFTESSLNLTSELSISEEDQELVAMTLLKSIGPHCYPAIWRRPEEILVFAVRKTIERLDLLASSPTDQLTKEWALSASAEIRKCEK